MADNTTSTAAAASQNPAAAASQNPAAAAVIKAKNTAANVAAASPNIYLETSKAEHHVWLMKCPAVVSRSFQNQQQKLNKEQSSPQFKRHSASPAPSPASHLFSSHDAANRLDVSSSGGPIAKVVVSVNPLLPKDDAKSTEFRMEIAGTESGNVPKIYSMDMSTDFVPMAVFSESSQRKLSVEGKIYHKFDMKPHSATLQDYGKLCRERTKKYMTKTRQVQVLGDDGGMLCRPMPGMVFTKSSGVPEKRKMSSKGSEGKRTKKSQDEVEKMLFRLFETKPNWTLKQLVQETDQPEQFLKEMLKLLCVYNNKGANQGTYELKPEYKNTGLETTASTK